MRSRLSYRSPVRLLTWTPIGILFVVAGVGATEAGEPPAMIFAGLGAVVLMYAWWPRLVISRDGVEVRNLTVTRLAWRDVAGVGGEATAALPGAHDASRPCARPACERAWYRRAGVPGLVINTHSLGPVAVVAAQRSVIPGRAGFADRARPTAARHGRRSVLRCPHGDGGRDRQRGEDRVGPD